ncbi:MAG: SigB/SigF/SigG family RNA polymerase sigma factor [Oscillospiraceae bacterium]|nr:SigB/SigF/SigG family RNA polymerase sigma factor [Oscillospiraceae bacterium]
MNPEETLALIRRSQAGDAAATERLVEENTGLVWSIVRRFFGRGVEADDLFQLGSIGFLKAVSGFDAGFGTRFSTYAVPKIAGEIQRFLRDDGSVKVSRGLKERAVRIRQARSRLEQRLGREPALSELSAELGLSPEDIAEAEAAAGPAESLQREAGEERFTLEQMLGDDGQEDRLLERFALEEAMAALSEREQTVLKLRFFHGLTQERTARVLGVSQVQVSRLERRALERLREKLVFQEE